MTIIKMLLALLVALATILHPKVAFATTWDVFMEFSDENTLNPNSYRFSMNAFLAQREVLRV